MSRTIGIDFDNTIVSYDAVFRGAAIERGLIDAGVDAAKRDVRDAVRRLPEGEVEWQKLQALVYGPLMPRASLIDGVGEFVRACRGRGVMVYIVSHKTDFAGYDLTGTNLRTAALDWMTAHAFFDRAGLGFASGEVFFESTREAKIARITALGCTHFVDDLEEVLSEPSFPVSVEKLLYASGGTLDVAGPVKIMPAWTAIHEYFFGDRA